MDRVDRLKKSEQFSVVFEKGITQTDRFLVVKALPNNLEYSRLGISVSKRVGKAVVRNRVKRLLREIVRLTPPVKGWDIVVIARNPAATGSFQRLNISVLNLLSRAKIEVLK